MSNFTRTLSRVDHKTGLPVLDKQPIESRTLNVDVSLYMQQGDTTASISAPTVVNMETVAGSTAITIISVGHNSGTILQFKVSGGTDGERYKISIPFTTAGEDSLEADVLLLVKDR